MFGCFFSVPSFAKIMQRFSFIHEWSTKLLPFIFLLLFLDSILWSHQSTQKSIQQTTLQLLLFYRVEKKMSIICLSQDAAGAAQALVSLSLQAFHYWLGIQKCCCCSRLLQMFLFGKCMKASPACLLSQNLISFAGWGKFPCWIWSLKRKFFLSPLRYNLFQSKCRFSIKLKFEVQVLLVDTSDVLIFEHCECRALLALWCWGLVCSWCSSDTRPIKDSWGPNCFFPSFWGEQRFTGF